MFDAPSIYMMANKPHGIIYIGVTSSLSRRVFEHKNNVYRGFTQRYGCHLLVYYETFENIEIAIGREKQLKAGSRAKKIALIEERNRAWHDLHDHVRW